VTRLAQAGYRFAATLLGWGSFAALCLVWGLLVIPLTLAVVRFRPRARLVFHDATRHALRLYLAIQLMARFQVERPFAPLSGPRILVANHQSYLDPILLMSLEPRLRGPARGYLFRVPILGSILRLCGFYDVDRGGAGSLTQIGSDSDEARLGLDALLFFPEGTRTPTGDVAPFRRGAFRVAFDQNLPIQPVVIEGLDRVLPRDHLTPQIPARYPVRVRYLEPVAPPYGEGIRRDVVRALASQVEGSISDELARMRSQRPA
jgi:1-acyl-sn-glycerol-3-phosphate acyltransferase